MWDFEEICCFDLEIKKENDGLRTEESKKKIILKIEKFVFVGILLRFCCLKGNSINENVILINLNVSILEEHNSHLNILAGCGEKIPIQISKQSL